MYRKDSISGHHLPGYANINRIEVTDDVYVDVNMMILSHLRSRISPDVIPLTPAEVEAEGIY